MSLSLALRLQRVLDRLWNAESLLFSLNLRSPFRNMQGSENESQKNYGTNMIKGKLFPRGTASRGGRKEPDFSHEKPFLPLLAREACWSFSRIQHKVDTSTSSLGKESQPLFFFFILKSQFTCHSKFTLSLPQIPSRFPYIVRLPTFQAKFQIIAASWVVFLWERKFQKSCLAWRNPYENTQ